MGRSLVAVVSVMMLAGCGGGDAGSTASSTTAPTTDSTTTSEVSTDEVPGTAITNLESTTGWRYDVRITPAGTTPDSSAEGCVGTAPPGRTNLQFQMEIENLQGDRAAPLPELTTALNMDAFGSAVTPNAKNVEQAEFSSIEISPYGADSGCLLPFGIGPGLGSDPLEIDAGDTVKFTIVAGALADPPPSGVELLIRAFDQVEGDSSNRLDWAVPFEG